MKFHLMLVMAVLALTSLIVDGWAAQEMKSSNLKEGVRVISNPSKVIEGMLLIPAGEYEIGFDPDLALSECEKNNSHCKKKWFEDEKPIHTVLLDAFYMDLYEVNQREFQQVMGSNPSEFKGNDLPVENVTWYEAKEYCQSRGKRLPTEAEWETAAKGMSHTIYTWGNSVESGKGNFCDSHCDKRWKEKQFVDGYKNTAPVGSFPSNVYGLFDMAGNVYEWVLDWYGRSYYENSILKNPRGPESGTYKVMRGGSWINYSTGVRPTDRTEAKTNSRYNFAGFRCAK